MSTDTDQSPVAAYLDRHDIRQRDVLQRVAALVGVLGVGAALGAAWLGRRIATAACSWAPPLTRGDCLAEAEAAARLPAVVLAATGGVLILAAVWVDTSDGGGA